MSDSIALIRTMGALLVVLGILAGALWLTRRYNLALPGTGFVRTDRRLAVIERLNLDPRRSVMLLRRDGVEHLLLLAPEGHLVIETRTASEVLPVTVEPAATLAVVPAAATVSEAIGRRVRPGDSFAALVERARRPLSMPLAKAVVHAKHLASGKRSRRHA